MHHRHAHFHAPKAHQERPRNKRTIANLKTKEPGPPRTVLYSLPIGISDGSGFGVVGTRINIWLNQKPRTAGAVVKWQFLLKWCKNVGYSKVSAKTVRAPATRGLQSQATLVSAHRIESCEPNLSQTCPTRGLFLGSQKQAFLASWLWALIVYIHKHMIQLKQNILNISSG